MDKKIVLFILVLALIGCVGADIPNCITTPSDNVSLSHGLNTIFQFNTKHPVGDMPECYMWLNSQHVSCPEDNTNIWIRTKFDTPNNFDGNDFLEIAGWPCDNETGCTSYYWLTGNSSKEYSTIYEDSESNYVFTNYTGNLWGGYIWARVNTVESGTPLAGNLNTSFDFSVGTPGYSLYYGANINAIYCGDIPNSEILNCSPSFYDYNNDCFINQTEFYYAGLDDDLLYASIGEGESPEDYAAFHQNCFLNVLDAYVNGSIYNGCTNVIIKDCNNASLYDINSDCFIKVDEFKKAASDYQKGLITLNCYNYVHNAFQTYLYDPFHGTFPDCNGTIQTESKCSTRQYLFSPCSNVYSEEICNNAYYNYGYGIYVKCRWLTGGSLGELTWTTGCYDGDNCEAGWPPTLPNESYGTLPGMNGSGGTLPGQGIGNITGLGSTILGFETNKLLQWFAIFVALGLLMVKPYKLGVSLSAFCVLFFTLMVQWAVFTGSVCLIICFLAGYEWVREYYS